MKLILKHIMFKKWFWEKKDKCVITLSVDKKELIEFMRNKHPIILDEAISKHPESINFNITVENV